MILIRDPFRQHCSSVITIGNFDGLHLGHQQLIHTLIASSREFKLPSLLLTFEPMPTEFFSPQSPPPRLMRFSEKWNAVKKLGIDYLCCLRFNAKLAALSAEDFVKIILVDQLGVKKIIVGDDFRFGAKRSGDVVLLKQLGLQYGFEVEPIPQLICDDERVSSTRIRNALKTGDFEQVKRLTGQSFELSGRVIYGDQLGRQWGYPTANIALHRKQVPLMGVFVVQVLGLSSKPLPAVASIGNRSTVQGKQIVLEVFIFDFDQSLYGKKITVQFLHKIRDQQHFDDVSDLIVAIQQDVLFAKQFFQV